MKKGLIFLVIATALIAMAMPAAYAIGVSPSETTEYFEPGLTKYVNLKISNSDGKSYKITAYAKGDLEDYISFPLGSIDMAPGDKEKMFTYRISLPDELKKKGSLKTKIIILAIPEKEQGDTQIQANTEIVSTLVLVAPYDELYAEAGLFIPQLAKGVPENLVVEINNHGTVKILDAYGIIDIYDPMGNKVLFLKSEAKAIEPKQKATIIVPWTPDLPNGAYRAVLTAIYDGENAKDEKELTIGSQNIIVKDISAKDFKLGGIAKFEILLESEWNQKIPEAYGMVYVMDKSDSPIASFKTPSTDLEPFGIQELEAFWDTNSIRAGDYKIRVDLNYLGKTTKEMFEVTVSPTDISFGATGLVASGGDKESKTLNVITLLVVVILLLVGAVLVLAFRKRK